MNVAAPKVHAEGGLRVRGRLRLRWAAGSAARRGVRRSSAASIRPSRSCNGQQIGAGRQVQRASANAPSCRNWRFAACFRLDGSDLMHGAGEFADDPDGVVGDVVETAFPLAQHFAPQAQQGPGSAGRQTRSWAAGPCGFCPVHVLLACCAQLGCYRFAATKFVALSRHFLDEAATGTSNRHVRGQISACGRNKLAVRRATGGCATHVRF